MESLQPVIQLHTLLGTFAASIDLGSVSRPHSDDQLLNRHYGHRCIIYLEQPVAEIYTSSYLEKRHESGEEIAQSGLLFSDNFIPSFTMTSFLPSHWS